MGRNRNKFAKGANGAPAQLAQEKPKQQQQQQQKQGANPAQKQNNNNNNNNNKQNNNKANNNNNNNNNGKNKAQIQKPKDNKGKNNKEKAVQAPRKQENNSKAPAAGQKRNKSEEKKVFVPAQSSSEDEDASDNDSDDSAEDAEPQALPSAVRDAEMEMALLNAEFCIVQAKTAHEFDLKRLPMYERRRAALKEVSSFWPLAIANHEEIIQHFAEFDFDVVGNISDVFVEHPEVGVFKLTMSFNEDNQKYFSNKSISATVRTLPKSLAAADLETFVDTIEKVDTINWAEGMNPMETLEAKGSKSSKMEARPYEGIFTYFTSQADPEAAADFFTMWAHELFPEATQFYMMREDDEEGSDFGDDMCNSDCDDENCGDSGSDDSDDESGSEGSSADDDDDDDDEESDEE